MTFEELVALISNIEINEHVWINDVKVGREPYGFFTTWRGNYNDFEKPESVASYVYHITSICTGVQA